MNKTLPTLIRIPEDFNWKRIIKTLRKQGLSHAAIAQRTGFPVSKIVLMETGGYDPEWIPIIKLLDLYHDAGNSLETVAHYEDDRNDNFCN